MSNGGSTALKIAIRHAEKVDRVIAASALLNRSGAMPQFWEFMKQAKLEHMPMKYKQAYLAINTDTAKLQTLHDKCAKRMVEFKDFSDEEIKSINAPVLLVSAAPDVATRTHGANVWNDT